MNAHERLEQQLRASISKTGAHPLRSRFRLRLFSRGITILVVTATTTAVAAAAVSYVVSRPKDPGPIPQNVDDAVVASAWNTAWAADPACRPGAALTTARFSNGTPSKAMLATFPVLRRRATSADRLHGRRGLPGDALFPLLVQGAVYVRFVRLARTTDGIRFYLLPADKLGRRPLSAAAANHCYQITVAALKAELQTVPTSERAATRRYGDAEFAEGRYNLETSTVFDGVFVLAQQSNPLQITGTGGQSVAAIQQHGVLSFEGPGASLWYGIVPAKVATVTLRFAARKNGHQRLPAITATGRVINNVVVIPAARRSAAQRWPLSAIWRSNSGTIIKTINERPLHP